jgi:hypothetical protein
MAGEESGVGDGIQMRTEERDRPIGERV